MNRKNPPMRWALPEVVDPENRLCYSVPVPDDRLHIAAFMGALFLLTKPYSWANDEDHTALDVAAVWKPIFDEVSEQGHPESCGASVPGILCISGTFADDAYGYEPILTLDCLNPYVLGTGWQSCYDSVQNKQVLSIRRDFDSSTFIRNAKYRFFVDLGTPIGYNVTYFLAGTQVYTFSDVEPLGGALIFEQDINEQADSVLVEAYYTVGGDGDLITLDDWAMCYTGDFPLSGSVGWTIDIPFIDGDGGFSPVVAGGITYSHYDGSAWYSGYEGQTPGQNYAQNQLYRVFTAPAAFSVKLVTLYVTCDVDTTWQTASAGPVTCPAGVSPQAVSFVPESPLDDPTYGSGTLRLIGTNDPLTAVHRIYLNRIVLKGTGVQPS